MEASDLAFWIAIAVAVGLCLFGDSCRGTCKPAKAGGPGASPPGDLAPNSGR